MTIMIISYSKIKALKKIKEKINLFRIIKVVESQPPGKKIPFISILMMIVYQSILKDLKFYLKKGVRINNFTT
jgi:transcriptional regulatory protein LevR